MQHSARKRKHDQDEQPDAKRKARERKPALQPWALPLPPWHLKRFVSRDDLISALPPKSPLPKQIYLPSEVLERIAVHADTTMTTLVTAGFGLYADLVKAKSRMVRAKSRRPWSLFMHGEQFKTKESPVGGDGVAIGMEMQHRTGRPFRLMMLPTELRDQTISEAAQDHVTALVLHSVCGEPRLKAGGSAFPDARYKVDLSNVASLTGFTECLRNTPSQLVKNITKVTVAVPAIKTWGRALVTLDIEDVDVSYTWHQRDGLPVDNSRLWPLERVMEQVNQCKFSGPWQLKTGPWRLKGSDLYNIMSALDTPGEPGTNMWGRGRRLL